MTEGFGHIISRCTRKLRNKMSIRTSTFDFVGDYDVADLQIIAAAQRSELMAAKDLDADLDYAFNLQLQEAVSASMSVSNPCSTSVSLDNVSRLNAPLSEAEYSHFTELQSEELLKLDQKLSDFAISETEFRNSKTDLHRRIHDEKVAFEISKMADEDWEEWGDNFERPFGEGSSKEVSTETFRVYCKGLVENHMATGNALGGIGIAICDSMDDLLLEIQKPIVAVGISRASAEICALIEGLNMALELGLNRVAFFCDYYPVFKFVTGRWAPKQRKVTELVNQMLSLQDKFAYCQPFLSARNDIKFAFKLAREAITSQVNRSPELRGSCNMFETCSICLEESSMNKIFSVDGCLHRYCFCCMKQHVEVKLLHGILPICPHEGCTSVLKISSCSKFLTPRLIEIMRQRVMESSIPSTEKVYCPYPRCSALMSKRELPEFPNHAVVETEIFGAMQCIKCQGRFCLYCKVPWHNNMTCIEYKRSNPRPYIDEAKLKNLAATNMWRQCIKCHHMIELAAGCYHITCRCGYEFCYTCGAEWRNKVPTCSCPIWDEENILDNEYSEDDYESESESDYSDDDYV